MSEVSWFTVGAEHYDQFKKDLAAEAAIDSERPIGSMTNELTKSNRELLIKVIILTQRNAERSPQHLGSLRSLSGEHD